MKILFDPELPTKLCNAYLFFDTNVFIGSFSYPDLFGELFQSLINCEFLTIPSVAFEFTRGSQTVDDYNDRVEYLKNLAIVYPIERHIDDTFKVLINVIQKIKGTASYTDFLFFSCLYKFTKSYLITADHNDCPLEILDQEFVITIDTGKDIKTYGIYKFSQDKFNKAAGKILKNI